MAIEFSSAFCALTGRAPFAWQRRLFEETVEGKRYAACDIPTGLGKTSIIPIWLIALAAQAERASGVESGAPLLPRRLVYVVNRRTVVDQATDVAIAIREALLERRTPAADAVHAALSSLCVYPDDETAPLAISTLRGEFADNREWQADPARAAVIVGTVDMIGSRLLFSGYGVSRRMRPFHAGLVGQDSLIVHDEAHLTPAFGTLLSEIARVQCDAEEPRPLRVMELTATQRVPAPRLRTGATEPFTLTENEKQDEIVRRRLTASKALKIDDVNAEDLPGRIAAAAVAHIDPAARVLVYVRTPKLADQVIKEIANRLGKSSENRIGLLTGTLRGYERDRLVQGKEDDPTGRIFAAFRAAEPRPALPASLFLVATSAGEVGVDLDADHLVCDLTPLDSMIQRLGRVNRLGRADPDFVAWIDVFAAPAEKGKKADDDGGESVSRYESARQATRNALAHLAIRTDGRQDASPAAMRALVDVLGVDGLERTFSPMPRLVPVTDVLLDAWALTSLREALPGRPPVERWLHGVESGPPDLHVAWREDVALLAGASKDRDDVVGLITTLFDRHRILTHERLRGPINDVEPQLAKLAKRNDDPVAILLPVSGPPVVDVLSKLLSERSRLHEATIVLDTASGGLNAMGLLDADAKQPVFDVADEMRAERRMRVLLEWDGDRECWTAKCIGAPSAGSAEALKDIAEGRLATMIGKVRRRTGMADRDRLVLDRDQDGNPSKILLLLVAPRSSEAEQETSAVAPRWQGLSEHNEWVREDAKQITEKLGLSAISRGIAEAIAIAAHRHDCGKDRDGWQKAIGHPRPTGHRKGVDSGWEPWAKSGERGFDDSLCGRYRHEFGSMLDAAEDAAVAAHPERDLILHTIAAHHGWSRPHFRPEAWDPDAADEDNAAAAAEAMRRSARLQRRFGRWGLAWLEALMRAADYAATKRLAKDAKGMQDGAEAAS